MSKLSSRGPAWDKTRRAVLERDQGTCAYCHAEADTVDHIVPKAAGGTDHPANLVAACRRCNGRKQDRTLIRTPYINTRWLDR